MTQILAGRFKGRKLLSPPATAETRPITGLAKKSLFDTLAPVLDAARVVDLYCGTGTMGLEALSRGAAGVWFAERDPRVLARLRRNVKTLGLEDRCTVWRGDVMKRLGGWLERDVEEALDVAFLDPPFAQAARWDFARAERALFAPLAARLGEGGRVVLRLPPRCVPPARLAGLRVVWDKQPGGMGLYAFGREAGD